MAKKNRKKKKDDKHLPLKIRSQSASLLCAHATLSGSPGSGASLVLHRLRKRFTRVPKYLRDPDNAHFHALSLTRKTCKKQMQVLDMQQLALTIQSDLVRGLRHILEQQFPEMQNFLQFSKADRSTLKQAFDDSVKELKHAHCSRITGAKSTMIDARHAGLLNKRKGERLALIAEFENPDRSLPLDVRHIDLKRVTVRAKDQLGCLSGGVKVLSGEDWENDEEIAIEGFREIVRQQERLTEDYFDQYVKESREFVEKLSGLNMMIRFTSEKCEEGKLKVCRDTAEQVESIFREPDFLLAPLISSYPNAESLRQKEEKILNKLEDIDHAILVCKEKLNQTEVEMNQTSGVKLNKSAISNDLLEACVAHFYLNKQFPLHIVPINAWYPLVDSLFQSPDVNQALLLAMINSLLLKLVSAGSPTEPDINLLSLSASSLFNLRKTLRTCDVLDEEVVLACDGDMDKKVFATFYHFFPFSAGLHEKIFGYLMKPLWWASEARSNRGLFQDPSLRGSIVFFIQKISSNPDQKWAFILLNFLDIIHPYTRIGIAEKESLLEKGADLVEHKKFKLSALCEDFLAEEGGVEQELQTSFSA